MLGIGFDDLRRREVTPPVSPPAGAGDCASIAGMVIASRSRQRPGSPATRPSASGSCAETEAETASQITRFIVDLFNIFDPSEGVGSTITAREILDKGAARIEKELADQPAIQATLMDTMGTIYTGLGLYPTAIPLLRAVAAKRRSLPGDTAVEIAKTLGHLGEALMRNANYDGGRRSACRTRSRSSASFSRQHTCRRREHVQRAGRCHVVHRRVRGGPAPDRGSLADPAQALRRDAPRRRDRASATSASISASAAISSRPRSTCARRWNAAQAASRRRIPDLAEAHEQPRLGAAGDSASSTQAEPLYREALEIKRKLLGDAHPELAAGLNNLGFVLETRGRLSRRGAGLPRVAGDESQAARREPPRDRGSA